jgi:tetratricopeptide (TPR) repeat protein
LNNALKREPTFAEAYFYKGFAYKESNNFEKALSNFTTATEQNPSWDEPYEQIGELYAQRKNEKAIVYFDNAVKVNRQNTSARLSKAYFYKTIGKLEMAENAYNDIIALFPQNVDAIYSIGVINFEKKKYDIALKQFNIATKVDPTFPDAYFMIGKIEKINGNKEKAKAAFKQALVFDAEFKEVPKEDINSTLDKRGSRYGDFDTQAMLTQVFVNTFNQHYYGVRKGQDNVKPLDPVLAEGIHMIFHKLARIANGDPLYLDNVRDISGYATLLEQYLKGVEGATDSQVTVLTKVKGEWK